VKRLLWALLALLFGCDDNDIAWRSELGIRMARAGLPNYFTPHQVDLHAAAAVGDLVAWGASETVLREALTHQLVSVWENEIPGAPGKNGIVLDNGVKVVAMPCVWRTALRHEMVHHLEAWVLNGSYDYAHTRAWWRTANEPLGDCLD
jgi:hypothetical protein